MARSDSEESGRRLPPASLGRGNGGMLRVTVSFFECEQGQDMVEYALLLAFVCLVGTAVLIGMGGSTSSLWTTVNNRLGASNQVS